MAAPPVSVDPEGLKPEGRRTGMPWIDLIIAASAIVLSVISLMVAIGNARTQEKMVQATTWPLLQYSSSNADPVTNEPAFSLHVTNTGVGPALVKSARLTYRGRPVRNWRILLAACCGSSPENTMAIMRADPGGRLVTSYLRERAIRPGEDVAFLRIRRTEANGAIWDALNRGAGEIDLELCYCSVFEECWRGTAQGLQAKRVETCPVDPSSEWD